MAKVFISYSRKDIEFAKQLTTELKKSDLDFWIDWEGIPPTVDWWKEIEKGIEEADIFLFLISPDSAKSKICGQEIDVAVNNGKRIIPIVVREIVWEDTPPQLGHLNYIFFSRDDDFDTAVKKLMTAIQTDYEWAATHRRLQVKALEWVRNHKEKSFLLRGKDLQDAEFQLSTNTSKEPHPTDLQREYVFNSRKAADRQRRITSSISIAAVIALAILAVFGLIQAGRATANANESQKNAATAQAASTLAFNNAGTAIANEQEARRQAQIALARQLVAQAQSVYATEQQVVAVLLATQSMRIFPSMEAAQILQTHSLAGFIREIPHPNGTQIISVAANGKDYLATGCARYSEEHSYVCLEPYISTVDGDTGAEITRSEEPTLGYTNDRITASAFSSDGKIVALGNQDYKITLWDVKTKNELATFNSDFEVSHIAFSPVGTYLAVSGDSSDTIVIWNISTGRIAHSFMHDSWVTDIDFSPSGENLISSSLDETVRIWSMETGEALKILRHNAYAVAVSPNGEYFVSAGRNGIIRIWDMQDGEQIAIIVDSVVVGGVQIFFSLDGEYVITTDSKSNTYVWDPFYGRRVERASRNISMARTTFHPNGSSIVSWIEIESSLVEWNIVTGEERILAKQVNIPDAISDDYKYFLEFEDGNTATLREFPTGTLVAQTILPQVPSFGSINADGSQVAISNEDESITLWRVAENTIITIYPAGTTMRLYGISPDGILLALADPNGLIEIMDTRTTQIIANTRHKEGATSLAFSPNSQYVISGSSDGTARIWEARTGRIVYEFSESGNVIPVSFSPDGKYVATNCYYDCVEEATRIWDVATGAEILRIPGKAVDSVPTILFSPDGKYIMRFYYFTNIGVELFYYRPEDMIMDGCAHLSRNLTRAEWNHYLGDTLPYQAVCQNLPIEPETALTPTSSP